MNLWRFVLDLFFPPNTEALTLLELDDASLEKLIHMHHHPTEPIRSLFVYRTPIIKSSIQALKYRRNTDVAKRYAHILADHILRTLKNKDARHILVPIPASKRRMREHGFNQCILITVLLPPLLGDSFMHLPDSLRRNDVHVSQTKLGKQDRLKNVHDTFVASETLQGKHVVIIDDVWTTGATAQAAIHACRSVGVQSVAVWTIAH